MSSYIHHFKRTGPYLLSLFLLSMFIYSSAFAQIVGPQKGDRVKVLAPSISKAEIIGTISNTLNNSININTPDTVFLVAYSSISKLAISTGKRRRVGEGAIIGLVAGGLVGGLIWASTYEECNEEVLFDCFLVPRSRAVAFIWGFGIGGGSGMLVGSIIGLGIKTDKWEPVPIKISAGLVPVNTGRLSFNPSVALRFSFNRK